MIGQKFGKLTIERETSVRIHGAVAFICKCDCGGTCLRAGRDLRFAVAHGVVPGCGCTALEQRRNVARRKREAVAA